MKRQNRFLSQNNSLQTNRFAKLKSENCRQRPQRPLSSRHVATPELSSLNRVVRFCQHPLGMHHVSPTTWPAVKRWSNPTSLLTKRQLRPLGHQCFRNYEKDTWIKSNRCYVAFSCDLVVFCFVILALALTYQIWLIFQGYHHRKIFIPACLTTVEICKIINCS